MRYLKTYKLFESIGFTESDIKDVFESYINWDLIRDAHGDELNNWWYLEIPFIKIRN